MFSVFQSVIVIWERGGEVLGLGERNWSIWFGSMASWDLDYAKIKGENWVAN